VTHRPRFLATKDAWRFLLERKAVKKEGVVASQPNDRTTCVIVKDRPDESFRGQNRKSKGLCLPASNQIACLVSCDTAPTNYISLGYCSL
jgi:hypothetical protein